MNRLAVFLIACLVLSTGVVAEEPPDWAKRDYAVPADQVYTAALTAIVMQQHQVKLETGKNTLTFHVGVTAWSRGYDMELTVTPIDDSHTRVVVGVSRSGGKTFSWGSGQKEVRKILDGIEKELAEKDKKNAPK
jgi:hypothetical protein